MSLGAAYLGIHPFRAVLDLDLCLSYLPSKCHMKQMTVAPPVRAVVPNHKGDSTLPVDRSEILCARHRHAGAEAARPGPRSSTFGFGAEA